jgi:hypothetical protein
MKQSSDDIDIEGQRRPNATVPSSIIIRKSGYLLFWCAHTGKLPRIITLHVCYMFRDIVLRFFSSFVITD